MLYKEIFMKTVGLITEYNPFHNGHLYHIERARELTGADRVVIVMSLRSMEMIADILLKEPPEYRDLLRENLRQGCSYPAARQNAVTGYSLSVRDKTASSVSSSTLADIMKEPNNILGIEYLKALKKLKSPITPLRSGAKEPTITTVSSQTVITVPRRRSALFLPSPALPSAPGRPPGHLKTLRFQTSAPSWKARCRQTAWSFLKDWHHVQYPVYANDFSLILKYKLLNKRTDSLIRYADVSEELASRITARLNDFFNYRQFCELLKTRETTQTRINRALLYIMLGIKKDRMTEYIENGFHCYARLLGIRKDVKKILAKITRESPLTLIARLSDSEDLPLIAQKMLRDDILASNLYMSVVTDKYKTAFQNEYKQALLKV